MIYFADAGGSLIRCVPQRIYQGSAEGNRLFLVAPFAESAGMLAAFCLPDGACTERYMMQFAGEIGGFTDGSGKAMYGWQLNVPRCVTHSYGTVTVQFYRVTGSDSLATFSARFTVERGVPESLPAEPSADVYQSLLSALAQVNTDVQNGLYAARALHSWSAGQVYGANEVVFYPFSEGSGALIRSKAAENDAAPYTEGVLDTEHWEELIGFDSVTQQGWSELQETVAAAQGAVTSEAQTRGLADQALMGRIDDIEDGTTTVAKAALADNASNAANAASAASAQTAVKAVQDGEGNVIASTYAKNSALTSEAAAREAADQALMGLIDDIEDGTTTVAKAALADNASNAANAASADSAQTAVKASQDALGNVINTTYLKKSEAPPETFVHNVTIAAGDGALITAAFLSAEWDALEDAADLVAFLEEMEYNVSVGPALLPASGYVVVTAGDTAVSYPVVGIGQYGTRTDVIGFYYFRADLASGRAGFRSLALADVTGFFDTVQEVV